MNIPLTKQVCRACATPSDKCSVYTPLFELSGSIKCVSKDIIEMIEMLQLNFKQNDGLPQKICFSCLKTLAAISEFRKRCEDVQKILSFYYKMILTESTRKKNRSLYADKIEHLKKPNAASGGEKLDDIVLEEITNKKQEPETRAPFVIRQQFSIKDKRLKRRSAVELTSANCGDAESNKPTLIADIGSDLCGKHSKQMTTDSKANNHMQTEVDPKLENIEYGVEISEIEFLDEKYLNEDDSRYSEQDLLLISSDDDNLIDANSQCEFSIATNVAVGEELPSSNIIENNYIEENTTEETTITKKPKKKMPKMETSQCHLCLGYYKAKIPHFRTCTARPKHRCKYCDFAFETSSELNDHIEKMHSDGLPACHICFASFENIKQRGEHFRKEHREVEFKCEKCDRVFSKKKHMHEHMERRHTEIINKECSMCNKVIKTEFLFQRHLKQHEMADRLKCQFCGKMFTRMQFKLDHERHHTGDTPYLCEICGAGIYSLADLHHHQKRAHCRDGKNGKKCRPRKTFLTSFRQKAPAEQVRFRCAFCPREFGTNYGLESHLQKHKEDRKFICEQCGNGFKRLVHLRLHERRMHTADKQFTCPECGKRFYARHELNLHMHVHTEERPLQCPHCPATFKHQKRLKSHLLYHSSEKPYVCHFCEKAYKFSKHLQAHFQSHHTAEEIKTLERRLVVLMEESIPANKILEQEEENMIEEPALEHIEFDYIIENHIT